MELLLGFFGFIFALLRFGARITGEKGYKKYVENQYKNKQEYIQEHTDPKLEEEYQKRYSEETGDFRELYYLLLSKEDWIKTHGTRRDNIVFDLWKLESGKMFELLTEQYKKWNKPRQNVDEFGLSNSDYYLIVLAEHTSGTVRMHGCTRPMYLLMCLGGKVTKSQAEDDAKALFDDKTRALISKRGYSCLVTTPRKYKNLICTDPEGIDERFPLSYPEFFV